MNISTDFESWSSLGKQAIITGVCVLLVAQIRTSLKKRARQQYLKKVAKECVESRNSKLHNVLSESVPATAKEVHTLSAMEIRGKVVDGSLKPSDIVVAFAARCSKYGREEGVNAITEEFYDSALQQAYELETKLEQGLLHGVPVSVKDCIGFAGALQTGGLACRAEENHRSINDSLVVQIVRSHGGLPMVRGNVSQSMMMPEAENNVFGRTVNPWDKRRTPGGSSGGEAALVAMGCVPLAIGTDVGGSVRIPAAFCGIVGFKGTPGRISKRGCMVPRCGNRHGPSMIVPSVIGPLAKTVDDCVQFTRAVLCEEHFKHDVEVPPFPFNEERYKGSKKKPMKIGYYVSDGWFEPCKTARRAIQEVVDRLNKEDGYTLEEIKFPMNSWDIYTLYVKLAGAEGNMKGMIQGLEGEELSPLYSKIRQAADIPNFLRPLIAAVIDERRGGLVRGARSGGISVYKYWQLLADLTEMRKAWAKMVEENEYDAILHPSLPLPAPFCGTSGDLTASFSYTLLANLLLWPEGSVPVTTIRREEQCYPFEDIPENQRDEFARCAQRTMVGSEGLPMGVSVLCPPYRDEECLKIMKKIESIIGFNETPSAYIS